MVVTESLAKGLRTNFWQLLEREAITFNRRMVALTDEQFDPCNTKQANRHLKQLTDAAKLPLVLHQGIHGTKHRATWWALFIQPDRARPITDGWTEACLRLDIHRVYLNPYNWRETYLPTLIGEHCIARLFQRLPWTRTPTASSILPTLRELTAHICWAHLLDKFITISNPGRALSLFIPTSQGVFFGAHHPQDSGLLEIRTFVARDQLTSRQLELWNAVMAARILTPMESFNGHLVMETPENNRVAMETCEQSIVAILKAFVDYQDVLDATVVLPLLDHKVDALGYRPENQRGAPLKEDGVPFTWLSK